MNQLGQKLFPKMSVLSIQRQRKHFVKLHTAFSRYGNFIEQEKVMKEQWKVNFDEEAFIVWESGLNIGE